jgi:hypothetical protein
MLAVENHAGRGAILDRAAGFCHSALAQSSTPGVLTLEARQADERGPANQSSTEVPRRSAVFNVEEGGMANTTELVRIISTDPAERGRGEKGSGLF